MLSRKSIEIPPRPERVVPVKCLGGDVKILGMMHSERLQYHVEMRELIGDEDEQSPERYKLMVFLLARVVVGDDDEPLLTMDEWDRLGGRHYDEVSDLFDIAQELSGLNRDAVEGNSESAQISNTASDSGAN